MTQPMATVQHARALYRAHGDKAEAHAAQNASHPEKRHEASWPSLESSLNTTLARSQRTAARKPESRAIGELSASVLNTESSSPPPAPGNTRSRLLAAARMN